jgi:hypothetical protein
VEVVAVEAPVEGSCGVVVAVFECGEPGGEDLEIGEIVGWARR